MSPEEQYPSTEDDTGKGEDVVLAILKGGCKRIEAAWTSNDYVGLLGSVCAVGAILVEDAGDEEEVPGSIGDINEYIERQLSDSAKEAISLLNEVALEEHPEAGEYGNWSGPLEWVNQSWIPDAGSPESRFIVDDDGRHPVQVEVVRLYKLAILRRRMTPVH